MKKTLAFVALLAISLSACSKTTTGGQQYVGACGQAAPGDPPSPGAQRGTLHVSIPDITNLNPLLASYTVDEMIARLMFEPLISANPKGEPVPILATVVPSLENGGISKDGVTITYHLRKDAKWTDGQPVTSNDVKWTWQAIMNKANNIISRHGYDSVSSIDTPDAYTVAVHLKNKFAPFVNTFFADSDQPYHVMPAHVLSQYPNINQIPFNSAPTVSDGPFKFVKWARGDHIEMAANDKFFMGKPGLAGIILRIIPNEETEITGLRTHTIDWFFEASDNNYPAAKSIPGICLAWVDVNGYEDLQINTQRPFTGDARVRQAIAYAVDKATLVQKLAYGQVREATEDQPPFMWSFDAQIRQVPHDLTQARNLLKEAGWTPGPDGIVRKNGQRLSLLMTLNINNATRRRGAVQIQSMLRSIGIDVAIKEYPANVLFAPVGEGGIAQGGKFDILYAGWYAGIDPDDSSQWTCANVAPKGYNYSRYCNQEMDAAQNQALQNYDIPTRKQAYYKIQEILARDQPEIYLYYLRVMHPISVNFKGFAPNPAIESWNAWQWSI